MFCSDKWSKFKGLQLINAESPGPLTTILGLYLISLRVHIISGRIKVLILVEINFLLVLNAVMLKVAPDFYDEERWRQSCNESSSAHAANKKKCAKSKCIK